MSFTWRKFNASISRGNLPTNCQICIVNIRDKKRDRRLFPQVAVWYDNRWWVRFCSGNHLEQIRVYYPSKVIQDTFVDPKGYRCYHCNAMDPDVFEVVSYAPFDNTVSVEEIDLGLDQMGLFEEFKEGGGVL